MLTCRHNGYTHFMDQSCDVCLSMFTRFDRAAQAPHNCSKLLSQLRSKLSEATHSESKSAHKLAYWDLASSYNSLKLRQLRKVKEMNAKVKQFSAKVQQISFK